MDTVQLMKDPGLSPDKVLTAVGQVAWEGTEKDARTSVKYA